jgi:hypothetical protein
METELYPLRFVAEISSGNVELPWPPSMIDLFRQLTIIQQHPEVRLSKDETSLVPNCVLRHLYTTLQRFQVVAPHLPLFGTSPAGAVATQPCLLAEITAAICARKDDRLCNARAAARLAQGEIFAELLKPATASATAHDALPTGVHNHFSFDQFAATLAFISKLRGEESVFFVMLGEHALDESFRRVLRACAECHLPILFYVETHIDLAEGKRARRNGKKEDSRPGYAESGVPVITTDIHDPVALYRVTTEAIHHARFGQGATVIESTRVMAAGKMAGLASPGDPLDFMKNYMQARGIWDNEWAQAQHRAAIAELRAALATGGD